jgi:hypothetical protein
MTRDELAAMILREIATRENEMATRPELPACRRWDRRNYDTDREHGPRYSSAWFGRATDTEARRVRVLRMVYKLADAGLVDITRSEGGRLERVRLTAAGRAAVTELTAAAANATT